MTIEELLELAGASLLQDVDGAQLDADYRRLHQLYESCVGSSARMRILDGALRSAEQGRDGHDSPIAELSVDDLRQLIRAGRSGDAVALADRFLATADEPRLRTQCLLMKIGALTNLSRLDECPAVIDAAFDSIRDCPDATLTGELHALTGAHAYLAGSLERCVAHLVRSSRALDNVERLDLATADAWVDLAVTYSVIGFHAHALGALDRSQRMAAELGLPPSEYRMPEIRVRMAVSLDHRGNTEGCVRMLREVLSDLPTGTTDQVLAEIPPPDGPYLGYAITRLAVLGEPTDLVPGPFLASRRTYDPESEYLRQLAEVCTEIAGGRPTAALAHLRRVESGSPVQTLGAAEPHRLAAIAQAARGDLAGASEAERAAFWLTAQTTDRMRDLFIDGVAARLDHETLRRKVSRYADEALTDPLTGLPNRRHLQQHLETLSRHGESGVLGLVELDGWKAITTAHGRQSGDLVIQRAATILARVMRRTDFLARFGDDEFVLLLPATPRVTARGIGDRIDAMFKVADWATLVPGTPVGVTVTWTGFDPDTDPWSLVRPAGRALRTVRDVGRAC